MSPQSIDVTVVGGGLSGLHTASELHARGLTVRVLEARERLGGRILSEVEQHAAFDLGPAWFWPHQKRMRALVADVGLTEDVFPQYDRGDALFEADRYRVQRGIAGISMAGSLRLSGGLTRLIDRVAERLPQQAVTLGARVTRVQLDGDRLETTWTEGDTLHALTSRFVVLALPPRLVASAIETVPPLGTTRRAQLAGINTWMAGHAKVVTLYERPFWRERGFSGDVISRVGPLHEIHDASPSGGGPHALFGFVGVPAPIRQKHRDELLSAATEQLVRLFGDEAAQPFAQLHKDWAAERYTATPDDFDMGAAHSFTSLEPTSETTWGHRLLWSGSETAGAEERNNGYLEGALQASERTVHAIRAARSE